MSQQHLVVAVHIQIGKSTLVVYLVKRVVPAHPVQEEVLVPQVVQVPLEEMVVQEPRVPRVHQEVLAHQGQQEVRDLLEKMGRGLLERLEVQVRQAHQVRLEETVRWDYLV